MIIFIIILIIIGMIAFYIWKTGLMNEEHFNEVQDLLNEIHARDSKIIDYEETIKAKKTKLEEENEEMASLNETIKELKEQYSSAVKEYNSKIDNLSMQLEIKNNLLIKESKKLAVTEESRRKSAGAVGGLTAKVNALSKELDQTIKDRNKAVEELQKAKYTIDFYKKHRKSPDIEKIKAYDFQFKEVEKRQNEKK